MTRVRQREPFFEYGNRDYLVAKAKTVIIATGGAGRMHLSGISDIQPLWRNCRRTGSGLPCRSTASVSGFYPVSSDRRYLSVPDSGALVTEKVRSVGAHSLSMQRARRISIRLKPVTSMRPRYP